MTSSGRVSRRALSLRDAGFAPVHGPLARRRTAGAAAGILARQLASASRLTVAGQHRNQTGLPPLVAYAVRAQYIHRARPRSPIPQPPRSSVLHSTMRVRLPLLIAQVAGMFCVFAAILFTAAGTIAWLAGWAFLALFFGFVIALSVWLIRYNPSLLTERMTGIGKSDQKLWDKFFFAALNGLFIVWLVTMPLDAVRFHWSNMPITLQLAGAIALTVSFYFFYQTFKENAFLSPAVRIQSDRGQHVVTTVAPLRPTPQASPIKKPVAPGAHRAGAPRPSLGTPHTASRAARRHRVVAARMPHVAPNQLRTTLGACPQRSVPTHDHRLAPESRPTPAEW